MSRFFSVSTLLFSFHSDRLPIFTLFSPTLPLMLSFWFLSLPFVLSFLFLSLFFLLLVYLFCFSFSSFSSFSAFNLEGTRSLIGSSVLYSYLRMLKIISKVASILSDLEKFARKSRLQIENRKSLFFHPSVKTSHSIPSPLLFLIYIPHHPSTNTPNTSHSFHPLLRNQKIPPFRALHVQDVPRLLFSSVRIALYLCVRIGGRVRLRAAVGEVL